VRADAIHARKITPVASVQRRYWKPDQASDQDTEPFEDQREPIIAGSALRGPLRHACSRLWRGKNDCQLSIIDPHAPGATWSKEDYLAELFGFGEHDGALLVSDAVLAEPGEFALALTQHHAEDEFTAGVYGSAKLDRTVVVQGAFKAKLLIEAPDEAKLKELVARLDPAIALARKGHVTIGGARFRGLGWLPWAIKKKKAETWSPRVGADRAGSQQGQKEHHDDQ
jgi:CRISPR/Cas system CSM-associated protein Csm3 (group 7 of RAMP superfamily)